MTRNNYRGKSVERSERILPILVYHASVLKKPITYEDLGRLIGVYYRHLARPLWHVGQEITELRNRWPDKIPLIQLLAYNKQKGLPGTGGLNWLLQDLLTKKKRGKLSKDERRSAVDTVWNAIYRYDRWDDVLDIFKMRPYKPPVPDLKEITRKLSERYRHGAGESSEHMRLKYFISQNPGRIKLPAGTKLETVEFIYPSLDRVDVLFRNGRQQIAVEVKGKSADENEIARGIYQCVKYQALSEAVMVGNGRRPTVRSPLVLEGRLPHSLKNLRNALGIEIIQGVRVDSAFKLPPGAKRSRGSSDERD
jgi:hypothetical protein